MKKQHSPMRHVWDEKRAKRILQLLGYDLSRNIHEQFLEKYGDKLKTNKKKKEN